jgi:hypothetical protein
MKQVINFDLVGIDSLSGLLCDGFSGYAVARSEVGRLRSLYLFIADGTVLRVQSKVTEVGGWREVGTMVFEHPIKAEEARPAMVPLAPAWTKIVALEKLILGEDTLVAECGIAIRNESNEQLLILPGAFPHTVEIIAPFYEGDFQPEYDLGEYKRAIVDCK